MRKLSKVLLVSAALLSISTTPFAEISVYPNAKTVQAQTAIPLQQATTISEQTAAPTSVEPTKDQQALNDELASNDALDSKSTAQETEENLEAKDDEATH